MKVENQKIKDNKNSFLTDLGEENLNRMSEHINL